MFKAEYVGELAHLKGATALCRYVDGDLVAQFDDMRLTYNGLPIESLEVVDDHARFPVTEVVVQDVKNCLGFGWHKFKESEFNKL